MYTKVPPIPFEESPVKEPEFEEIPAHLLQEIQQPPPMNQANRSDNEENDIFA
jgi:hypothetical protein